MVTFLRLSLRKKARFKYSSLNKFGKQINFVYQRFLKFHFTLFKTIVKLLFTKRAYGNSEFLLESTKAQDGEFIYFMRILITIYQYLTFYIGFNNVCFRKQYHYKHVR